MASPADELKILLADVVTFAYQAQGCHWNVEGIHFQEYHDLFGEIYEDVFSSIDPLAENIRKMDEYVPFSLARFVEMRTIDFTGTSSDAREMVGYLLRANDFVIISIDRAFRAADSSNEQGIADFLSSRDDAHKNWRWQLRSALR